MGVGLTLRNDAVQVLFIDDGVFALLQTDPDQVAMPEYARHIETLKQLGHRICAEHESLAERGIERPSFEPEIVPRGDVPALLLDCDGVVRY